MHACMANKNTFENLQDIFFFLKKCVEKKINESKPKPQSFFSSINC